MRISGPGAIRGYDGLIRPPGWTRLPSIRRITDLLALTVKSVIFEPLYYVHPMSTNQSDPPVTVALDNRVNGEGKPIVALVNGAHAVTLVKVENQQYVLKNSYGTNDSNNPAWIMVPTSRPPGTSRNGFKN